MNRRFVPVTGRKQTETILILIAAPVNSQGTPFRESFVAKTALLSRMVNTGRAFFRKNVTLRFLSVMSV